MLHRGDRRAGPTAQLLRRTSASLRSCIARGRAARGRSARLAAAGGRSARPRGARHRSRVSAPAAFARAAAPPPLRAVDGVSLTVHAGETVGSGGRVGLRQVEPAACHSGARSRAHGGKSRLLGEEFSAARGESVAPSSPLHPGRVPRSVRQLRSPLARRAAGRGTFFLLDSTTGHRGAQVQRRAAARAGRSVGGRRTALSARILGRRAPADRHRSGADHGARGDRVR